MRRLLAWWALGAVVVAAGCAALLLVVRSSLSDRISLVCDVDGSRVALQVHAAVHPPHRLRVDWGDGTSDGRASHDYARPGRYDVLVTVTDGRGHRLVERCAVEPGQQG